MYQLSTLEYQGITKTLVEWCAELNLNYQGVRQRKFKSKGTLTSEEILFGKIKKPKKLLLDVNGLPLQKQRSKVSKMLSQYKLKDIKKGYEYSDISIDEGIKLFNQPCIYCGDTKNIGLDRIDNSKGHTRDNVVPCCYTCNVARSNNFTHEEMFELGKTISEIKRKRNENN